jgi:hypothetical protein
VVSFPQGSPPKHCIHLTSHNISATCPAHHILLDLITRTILGEQHRSLSSSLCSFLLYSVTPSLLAPYIPGITLPNTVYFIHLTILVNQNKYLCYTSVMAVFILIFSISEPTRLVQGNICERISKSW